MIIGVHGFQYVISSHSKMYKDSWLRRVLRLKKGCTLPGEWILYLLLKPVILEGSLVRWGDLQHCKRQWRRSIVVMEIIQAHSGFLTSHPTPTLKDSLCCFTFSVATPSAFNLQCSWVLEDNQAKLDSSCHLVVIFKRIFKHFYLFFYSEVF